MALAIVADSNPAPALPGITRSSRWSCDVFSGSAAALIAAGIITREQLEPQKGRQPGVTAFLARGEPCPPHLNAWREPGYKAIRQQNDGSFVVEVTVAKEVQAWRRKAVRAAKHEQEQQRIDKELEENGRELRNWQFRQDFGGGSETWEGTKTQLQAAGLGIGMRFPGEPGGPSEHLVCKCPLGFEFRVSRHYNTAKEAAGIYIAHSWYTPHGDRSKEFAAYAPGVLLEVWRTNGWLSSDSYHGTAEALVAAGLVRDLGLFPGQPGRNKMQAAYRKDWSPCTSANGQDWGATIRKRGKGQFTVDVPVGRAEEERRRQQRKAEENDKKRRDEVLAAERKKLRQGALPEKSADQFRAERADLLEFSLKLLWRTVFGSADGALSFDLPEGSKQWDDLAEAFETMREVVNEAGICRDKQVMTAARTRLKLVAARNDQGLQSMLQQAKGLRLVDPTRED